MTFDPAAIAAYTTAPREIDNPRLPSGVWYVLHPTKADRPYAQRANVIQKLKCMPRAVRPEARVFYHRTEICYGPHGWIDVTDQFIDADGNVITKS